VDVAGVRWTRSVGLLTGRFGVRVPGGAPREPARSGRFSAFPCVEGICRGRCRGIALPLGCLPPRRAAYRRGERAAEGRWQRHDGYGLDAARAPSRGGRLQAQVSFGTSPGGRRIRRSKTFDSRTQAEAWIATQQLEHRQLTNPVTDERLADYLRWCSPSKRRRASPAAGRSPGPRWRTTGSSSTPLIPELGHREVGQLTVRELDAFASRTLAAGYAPATVNRMRETLRSAPSGRTG
jgi:hypothetical protein